MAIPFNEIPNILYTPGVYVEYDDSRAGSGIQFQPHDALIIANMRTTGTATADEIIRVDASGEAPGLFGAGSQAALMVAAFKAIDRATPLYVCPMDDAGAGVEAVGTWTFSGTATEDGYVYCYVAGRRFGVAVEEDDGFAAVVTALVAAAGDLIDLPGVITDGGAGALTYTDHHAAAFSNYVKIGLNLGASEHLPAGLACTVVQPTGGSGDIDLDTAVTAMGDDQYNTVVVGVISEAEIDTLVTEMESREGPLRCIEGVAFGGVCDSVVDTETYLGNFNSHRLVMACSEESGLVHTPWEVAAQAAAINCKSTQINPAQNNTGYSFSGVSAAPRGARFNQANRQSLLEAGGSTVRAGSDGRLLVDRLVTTRTENELSLADLTWQDLSPTVRVLDAIRYAFRARMSSKFIGMSLGDDGDPPRPGVVTPSVIKAESAAMFLEWFGEGWVENITQFMEDLVVIRNVSDPNRIDVLLPPDIINSLLVVAAQISFLR